jgi:hypothetical protein
MRVGKETTKGVHHFSVALYGYFNKWYIPFGLTWWNRKDETKYGILYYTKLRELSIGFLCFRLQFQWWREKCRNLM